MINTGTTIVTFLMVFLIQNTQNRDSAAVHLKLDELIRAVAGAHNALLDLEELTERDLARCGSRYEELARRSRAWTWKADSSTPARQRSLTADVRRSTRCSDTELSYRSLSAVVV